MQGWSLGCSTILVAGEEKGPVTQTGGSNLWLSTAVTHAEWTGLCQ